jgi:hypothetical protein
MSVVELMVRTRSGRRLRIADVRWELLVFPEVQDVRRLAPDLVGVYCSAEPRIRAWRSTLERLGYEVDLPAEALRRERSASAA